MERMMNGAAGECLQLLTVSGGAEERPLTGQIEVMDDDSVSDKGDHNLNLKCNKNEGKAKDHDIII